MPRRRRQKSGVPSCARMSLQAVVTRHAAAELHLRLAGRAGRARRARRGSRRARSRRSARAPPTARPDRFMYVVGFTRRRSPPPCATSPGNLRFGANASAELRRERVGEPEARVVARARRARGPDCRGRRRVGSGVGGHRSRRRARQRKGPPAMRAAGRSSRRAAATYFFLSSLPAFFVLLVAALLVRARRRASRPAAAARRGAAAAAAASAAASSSVGLDLRLRDDRGRDHRIGLPCVTTRHARRQLERRDVDRVADVERRQVDLDELRQVLRQAA